MSSADAPPAPASQARFALAVLVVAAVAALAAVGFRDGLHEVYALVLGDRSVLHGMAMLPWWACIALPASGAALAALIAQIARGGNSGVGGVMEAVALGRGRISFRASAARVVACFTAVATGSAIGREGPIIQLGAGIGDALGQRIALLAAQRRILIAAGTAAGFAAAYGTPLAALLFVAEVVTISTAIRLILATAVAAALASIIAGFGPLYGARTFAMGSPIELVVYAGIGVGVGVIGVLFMRLLSLAEHGFARIPGPPSVRAAIGGAIAGAIAIGVPEVAGNGLEALRGLLDVGAAAGVLALFLVARAVATSASVGSGVPGGVFTPALFLGAAAGRLVALGLVAVGIHVDGGACTVAGMAAACASTTHAPLMAAVMMLELTSDASLALPVLLASTIATLTARAIHRESLYTEELRRRRVVWPARLVGPPVAEVVEDGGGI
ncbi:MAG: chloride channel protein [Deltaproteobacteria bacterium]|nr:chloride channel protein [Deltaproteobacteria bacterium]